MADILTNGRVIFGVGRGYHTREVETFGSPMLDGDANRELFEEQIEIILTAFREESFSYQGEAFSDSGQGAVPRVRTRKANPGAPASKPTGGGLAASGQRKPPRH